MLWSLTVINPMQMSDTQKALGNHVFGGNIVEYYFKYCGQEDPWAEKQTVKCPKGRNMVHVFAKRLGRQFTCSKLKEEVK